MSTPASELRYPDGFLAIGFGAGLAPKAPGTFGSIAAIPLVFGMIHLPLAAQCAVIAVAVLIGIPICGRSAKRLGVADHSAIVWDEIAGMLIACLALPAGWLWLLGAFGLFRLLDITKPWPIGWVDRRVHGGLGIMADDVIAGAVTCAAVQTVAALI